MDPPYDIEMLGCKDGNRFAENKQMVVKEGRQREGSTGRED